MTFTRVLIGGLLFLTGTVAARGDESWTGKWIILKNPGVEATRVGAVSTTPTRTEVDGLNHRVVEDKGDRILLSFDGDTWWVWKRDAVLVRDGIEYFSQRLKENPREASAFLCRSYAYFQVGQLDGALADCNSAVRLDPTHPAYWAARASVRYERHEFDDAVRDATEAIRQDPDNSLAYCVRALARLYKREYVAALADSDAAVRLNPKSADVYYARGKVRQTSGQIDLAIRDFDQAVRLELAHPSPLILRSDCWREKADYARAIRDLDAAIRMDPDDVDILRRRAYCYFLLKQYGAELRDLEAAIRLAPDDIDSLSRAAFVLAACPDATIRDGIKAIELVRRACNLTGSKDAWLFAIMAMANAEAGQFDEAKRWQEKALKDPEYVARHGDWARDVLEGYRLGRAYRLPD